MADPIVYRLSEGVLLRRRDEFILEGRVDGKWAAYPGIEEDWYTNSSPADPDDPEFPFEKFDPDQPRDEGGQWTSGGSAPGTATVDGERVTLPSAERMTDILRQAVSRTGVDPSKLKLEVREGRGPDFQVGSEEFHEAGHFMPDTGEVVLYTESMLTDSAVESISAHEAQHAVWHEYRATVDRERSEIEAERARLEAEGKDWYKEMHFSPADDRLREPYASRWPATAAEQTFHQLDHEKRMALGEGISAYAGAYWRAWREGKMQTDRATNETLAEIARIRNTQPGVKIPQAWLRYYRAVVRSTGGKQR